MENESLQEYRKSLIEIVPKLNENYNKLIVTLSGGALGLSIVFLKDIIAQDLVQQCNLIIVSWVLLIFSLTSVLGSLLFGIKAHKKAIAQVDRNLIYSETPGGIYTKITDGLHYSGTLFLVIGLILLFLFAGQNMEVKYVQAKSRNAKIENAIGQTTGQHP